MSELITTRTSSFSARWNDKGSGATRAPNGYVELGDVAMSGLTQTPATSDIWCVRQDLVKQGSFASNSIWDDKKSKAKSDVSIWEIQGINRTDPEEEVGITAIWNYLRKPHL
ncbi:vacuolar protein sorting-associated protein 62 domain-containing protein [Trichoderma breve]|uniref:Vacuolar protein sorting-associated protein 62 domain-containing protein n=1 Tax=Trichoderma breve TaxID=2034170 RepID=A0A9W9E8R2_9HYPO|nr:vacuolar protein sorting-associated protein 62 domain-containing protein [Trichoderma breve]KAJ4860692.1 vacuolar protein sorting-associated protein 62 domain-containing protein [Trichoderma breve]